MSTEPYILITADTHAGGSHAQYREYLDPQWREAFDEWRGGWAVTMLLAKNGGTGLG